jgi:hypothetical protein
MKSLKWLVTIALLIWLIPSVQGQQLPISIKAEVFKEIYFGFGSAGSTTDLEYQVRMVIINNQKKNFVFDEVLVVFSPKSGTPLRQHMYHNIDKDADLRGQKGPPPDFVMSPGQKEDFEFRTNGYTTPLLADAGKYPLVFSIVFLRKKQIVAGPYQAPLPSLTDLPNAHKAEKGRVLKLMAPVL